MHCTFPAASVINQTKLQHWDTVWWQSALWDILVQTIAMANYPLTCYNNVQKLATKILKKPMFCKHEAIQMLYNS